MKIHFVVGTLGSGRQRVYKKLLFVLKSTGEEVLGTELNYIDPHASAEEIVEEVRKVLQNNLNVDHFVFTGTSVSLAIVDLLFNFSDAATYFVKRDDPLMEVDDEVLSKFSVTVTKEAALSINQKIRDKMDSLVKSIGASWKPVESPVLLKTTTPNYAATETSSISMLVASHNIA